MLNTPFSPWPCFTEEEADAVKNVLLSNRVNYWTGTECREFEKEFATWCGTEHAIAVANGTLALDACLATLNIGTGDEVIVTSRTFLASVSAIANTGAKPVFADIDRDSQNIIAATIEPLLTLKTKAIVCVHLAGWPCEMDEIRSLATTHNLKIIEDCAQAHGAAYNGKPVGSLGDIAAWSFCQDKIMTTGGEGGMVTTNNKDLWDRAWSLKDHGKEWSAVYETKHSPGFRWLHNSLGHNWRMTEMQGAIGRIQLLRMTRWSEARTRNATKIQDSAKSCLCFRIPETPDHISHANYKCYVFIRPERLKLDWNRDRIMNEINKLGVPCFSGSCSEVYLEKAFTQNSVRPTQRLPAAKELGETSLMFLVHPTLTENEINQTCSAIKTVAEKAGLG